MRSFRIKQRDYDQRLFPGADTLHPVLARVYAGRKIASPDQLDYSLANLIAPAQLKGIDQAVAILEQALDEQQRVLVIGDFDVDGATSITVAVEILRALGARHVDYLVPDRFKYGYGLTPEIVDVALDYSPQLIITVDNGIASVAGVDAARQHGIRVLVTDHHLPGEVQPAADAIVNPNQFGDTFPSKSLAGVGVIFYLMMALRTRLRDRGWFARHGIEEPNLGNWLDLVALGTVADMVKLDYNNRILVSNGLARINAGQSRPGIDAILRLANRLPARLTSTDLGFIVAPRLNAAGRLDDMSIGIECLLSRTLEDALPLASQLESLNAERRNIQADMQQQAMQAIAELAPDRLAPGSGICLYDSRWHQGVVGLIASKIKERSGCPAIVFADGDGGELKGSARSVDGVHIRDLLDSLATHNPGLLIKFGGHAMAAGLSISADRFEEFATAFNRELDRLGADDLADEKIYTDGELASDELNLDTATTLKLAGPWGQGFPEPLFEGRFEVLESRLLKDRHLKFLLRADGRTTLDAIAFNYLQPSPEQKPLAPEFDNIHIVYRLDINEFRGNRKTQLIIDHIRTQ